MVAWDKKVCLGWLKSNLWYFWICLRMKCRVSPGFHPWVVCGAKFAVVIGEWGGVF